MRKIAVRFPDFDADMVIELEERNKELCDEVWEALPFTYVQEHAMVSGKSMYGWVPMISTAKIPYRVRRDLTPVGFVGYNNGTGNKISMKYGPITEPLLANCLGFIPEQYHKKLGEIGEAVFANCFLDKKVFLVEMERLEENGL